MLNEWYERIGRSQEAIECLMQTCINLDIISIAGGQVCMLCDIELFSASLCSRSVVELRFGEPDCLAKNLYVFHVVKFSLIHF